MTDELKPCPWCGAPDISLDHTGGRTDNAPRRYFFRCQSCGRPGPERNGQHAARDAWNTRPVEDELRAALRLAISFLHTCREHTDGCQWCELKRAALEETKR